VNVSKKCNEVFGYYGGSFDMPTLGHTLVADNFLRSGLIDHLIVSPAGKHAHGKTYGVSDNHRIIMVQMMVKDLRSRWGADRVTLSRSEIQSPDVSYTYNALCALAKVYAGAQIALLIGQDCLNNFHLWNNYQEILNQFRVLVHPRIGSSVIPLPGMTIISANNVNGASGVVKQRLMSGDKVVTWLLPEIHDYIVQNSLYI